MAALTLGVRRPTLAALLLLASLVLGACSAAAPSALNPATGTTPAPAQQPAGEPGDGATANVDDQLVDGAHIVRTGVLTLEVEDLAAAVDGGARVVIGTGGYVGSSEERHSASGGWASVTYRIPVERWEDALAGLRALGRVIDQNTEALDVTGDIVDLDARLANLRTTEAALQAIMDRATTISDVLKVQSELTAVRGEIERLAGQRDNLAQRAALATLTVEYGVPTVAVTEVTEGWDPGREVDAAVAALVAIGQRLTSLLIWLTIVVLPVVGPFVLVGYVAYRIARGRQIRATMQPGDPRR